MPMKVINVHMGAYVKFLFKLYHFDMNLFGLVQII